MKSLIAAGLLSLITIPAVAQNSPRMPMAANGSLTPQMFRTLDTNNDGSVSDEEYRAYQHRRFRSFEEPGRGQFGRETFRSRMAMMGRRNDADRDFRGYDANQNGTVTHDEWMKWAENHFKLGDSNGYGKITAEDPAPRRNGPMGGMGNSGPGVRGGMGMMGDGGPGPHR